LCCSQVATASILFNFGASGNGYFFFESTINTGFVCFGHGGAGAFNGTCANGVASNAEWISLNKNEQNTPLSDSEVVAAPEPSSIILLVTGLSLGAFRRIRRGQLPSV
jgi:hypothetical protein